MTSTRDKLNETQHFLEEMKKSPFHTDAFRYNLSAFLSAARSVTFMMQKEFPKCTGFNEWYKDQVDGMKQDKFMVYLDRQRDMAIHERSVKSHGYVSVIEEMGQQGTKDLVIHYHLVGTGGPTVSVVRSRSLLTTATPTGKDRCYFDDIADEDVMTLCEKHFSKLRKIVNECEAKFKLAG